MHVYTQLGILGSASDLLINSVLDLINRIKPNNPTEPGHIVIPLSEIVTGNAILHPNNLINIITSNTECPKNSDIIFIMP